MFWMVIGPMPFMFCRSFMFLNTMLSSVFFVSFLYLIMLFAFVGPIPGNLANEAQVAVLGFILHFNVSARSLFSVNGCAT